MKSTINFFFLLSNLFGVFTLFGQKAVVSESERLGNFDIKNYSNKFLERPESVWSVLRSNKSKKVYFGTYGGILEYDGKNVNTYTAFYSNLIVNDIEKLDLVLDELERIALKNNLTRHQFANSECGVYSMNFIIRSPK